MSRDAVRTDVILERLSGLHPKLIDLSLVRVERLLKILGDPQDCLAPTVHIAGTNGKGSTLAYLRAMLEASGYAAHVYTSPHLVQFNERIRLAGELITEDALSELLEAVEEANGGEPITFFEITTAAAFVAFASIPADIVLLETGLGGRLDTTNVIKTPALTVITPISHDHHQFLGTTLAEIAREKAGILKPGYPCVVARQSAEAMQSIVARADDLGCALFVEEEDWSVHEDGGELIYQGPRGTRRLPLPNLPGAHQIGNAGLALAALDRLPRFTVTQEKMAEGLSNTHWPGRLQRLTKGPLVDLMPAGWELWLDGGHNASAGEAIAQYADVNWVDQPLYLISGMLNSKSCDDFLRPLAGIASHLSTVAIPGEENTVSAEDLSAIAASVGMKATPMPAVTDALSAVPMSPGSPGRVLICGSLYLAGTVLSENS
jgi:dihydrofolate synthase / folylpolyglutamate synthase